MPKLPPKEQTAAALIPERPSLTQLRQVAASCQACDLYARATQTVFGEGAAHAKLMFVGEQPGNQEDLQGHPFVGPAGGLLDKVLEEVGIDRRQVYVTNVVKHFNWKPTPGGKRRIHAKPNQKQINACRPWLEAEIKLVKPQVLVCLGATAAQALLGKSFKVSEQRGLLVASPLAHAVIATVHPSSILRSPDEATRRIETERFTSDMRIVAEVLARYEGEGIQPQP